MPNARGIATRWRAADASRCSWTTPPAPCAPVDTGRTTCSTRRRTCRSSPRCTPPRTARPRCVGFTGNAEPREPLEALEPCSNHANPAKPSKHRAEVLYYLRTTSVSRSRGREVRKPSHTSREVKNRERLSYQTDGKSFPARYLVTVVALNVRNPLSPRTTPR